MKSEQLRTNGRTALLSRAFRTTCIVTLAALPSGGCGETDKQSRSPDLAIDTVIAASAFRAPEPSTARQDEREERSRPLEEKASGPAALATDVASLAPVMAPSSDVLPPAGRPYPVQAVVDGFVRASGDHDAAVSTPPTVAAAHTGASLDSPASSARQGEPEGSALAPQELPTAVLAATRLPEPDPDAAASERLTQASMPPPRLVAIATSALADDRAYVPQIGPSEREAYLAQIDLEPSHHRLAVRIGSEVVGQVQFQVSDGQISVQIGQVLDLFEARMEPTRFAALRSSGAAREFVPLAAVQQAGVALEYDPVYDELVLGG